MQTRRLESAAPGDYLPLMLDRLLTLFRDPEADVEIEPEDEREAVAALLVEAAHADGHYDESERSGIDRVLARRYGLSPWEAGALRSRGEEAQAKASDLVRFTQAIKRVVPYEARIEVVEAIWEVAYSDGERDHTESALVRRLCGLLYVPDKDAGLARRRVEARMGG